MEKEYKNLLGSERTIEITFIEEMLEKYYKNNNIILDVGGITTNENLMKPIRDFINKNNVDYRISDFRHCQYQGDFVQYDFKSDKFDIVIFLSSLEHFPQCTESDVIYRDGYDKKGYEKALKILNDGGLIFLTVPFGKHVWQKYHQNYDMEGILRLIEGSEIVESHTYRLTNGSFDKPHGELSFGDGIWKVDDYRNMTDILYTDRAYGVGCFVMKKK